MVRSKLRSPASTWATGTPSFTAASAQATVELTSPNTTGRGPRLQDSASKRSMICAVCAAWEPEPTSRWTSGCGMRSSSKEDVRHRLVVVLAGVDDPAGQLPLGVESADDRGDLHEIGAGARDEIERQHGELW